MGRKNSPSAKKELVTLITNYEEAKAENRQLYLDADQLADIADWYASERKFEEAQEVLQEEIKDTDIKVNYFEKPVISGYKGETVLLIICELQKNNKFSEDYYSLVQGGIIVKPK